MRVFHVHAIKIFSVVLFVAICTIALCYAQDAAGMTEAKPAATGNTAEAASIDQREKYVRDFELSKQITITKFGVVERNDGVLIGYTDYFYHIKTTYFWRCVKPEAHSELSRKKGRFVADEFCTDFRKEKFWLDDPTDEQYLVSAQSYGAIKDVSQNKELKAPKNGEIGFVALNSTTLPKEAYLSNDDRGYLEFVEKFIYDHE